jgi:hypothetical protein
MIISVILFGLYVERSKKVAVPERQPIENEVRSVKERTKELIDDFGVELEKKQGVNRTYIGDEETGIVVNVPRNPLIGSDEVKEKEYNSIVDVLYMFEEDLNYGDGTQYFGFENNYYSTKEDAIEFIENFFNEDINYTSRVNAYTKIQDDIYYVKAEFIQFNYGEEKNVSDFHKVMEFTVDTKNSIVFPSKYIKTDSIGESFYMPDCNVLIKSADFYLSELYVKAEISNKSNERFNFKDRYNLIAKAGEMELDKGFDVFTSDFDLLENSTEDLKFKYVYNYTPNLTFDVEKLAVDGE